MVASREATPEALLEAALARVAEVNGALNAVVLPQEAVARGMIADGLPQGPLTGVPFLLKDVGAEAVDFPAHSGSRLHAGERYERDSYIYARLAAAGLVSFARTTSPEGAIGPVTEAAVYGGPTRNPWDLTRSPGGSSGGAGAAVAAGIVPAAHGSDGGGSIRIPASCCGLVGFKASRARLPDGPYAGEGWGGMAIDGYLTRSLRDTALLMDATMGHSPGAPYCAPPMAGTHLEAMQRPPGCLRVAVCDTTLTGGAVAPECRDAVEAVAKLLDAMGHEVVAARPGPDEGVDTEAMMAAWTRIVACGTALAVDKAVAARGQPLGEDEVEGVTRGAMEYARRLSGADYLEAIGQVHRYGRQMAAWFAGWDVLLTPTLAEPPAKIGRFTHDREDFEAYRMGPGGVFEYSPFTAAFNATGQPAISLPLYWSGDGLPIGVQLAAPFGHDERLIALSAALELAQPWFDRRPPPVPARFDA